MVGKGRPLGITKTKKGQHLPTSYEFKLKAEHYPGV
jgi:hypothetical protein